MSDMKVKKVIVVALDNLEISKIYQWAKDLKINEETLTQANNTLINHKQEDYEPIEHKELAVHYYFGGFIRSLPHNSLVTILMDNYTDLYQVATKYFKNLNEYRSSNNIDITINLKIVVGETSLWILLRKFLDINIKTKILTNRRFIVPFEIK